MLCCNHETNTDEKGLISGAIKKNYYIFKRRYWFSMVKTDDKSFLK